MARIRTERNEWALKRASEAEDELKSVYLFIERFVKLRHRKLITKVLYVWEIRAGKKREKEKGFTFFSITIYTCIQTATPYTYMPSSCSTHWKHISTRYISKWSHLPSHLPKHIIYSLTPFYDSTSFYPVVLIDSMMRFLMVEFKRWTFMWSILSLSFHVPLIPTLELKRLIRRSHIRVIFWVIDQLIIFSFTWGMFWMLMIFVSCSFFQ